MTCTICTEPITGDVNWHHPHYRSNGGTDVEPTHPTCHTALHSSRGDFKAWGRIGGQISALSKRWAFNLKNVRTDPAHNINRQFYSLNYAH